MPTECSAPLFDFGTVEGRRIEASFDGGDISSDAGGALLLRQAERRFGLLAAAARCLPDRRNPGLVQHTRLAQLTQRVFGIALGYEDLTDHDQVRHDPVLATLTGKLRALAVATAKRSSALPEVPTVAESGLPGFEAVAWFGIVAPPGTPAAVAQKVSPRARLAAVATLTSASSPWSAASMPRTIPRSTAQITG